ncbi:hypothetical protein [Fructobacillus tropaeoli]|uniref:hypothetical protein n=1 Tax=Fructobacillus tropaeoli TaxID=709323 RepID=UPI002DADAFEE|nr:unnamed protein product [Fructobacillus tropaeoli]
MKHAPEKKSKTLLIFTILVIVIIVGTICYFIGKASNSKLEEASNSSFSVSSSSRVSSSNNTNTSNSSQLSSSTQLNKDQETKQSTQTSSSQSSSQPNTTNQNLVYYNGQSQITLPTTDGTIQPQQQGYPDGATFWPSTLTINGQKENVIASYSRQGYFAIYTKEPTSKPQGFTYNGVDFVNHIGDKDLDPLASSSKTIRY